MMMVLSDKKKLNIKLRFEKVYDLGGEGWQKTSFLFAQLRCIIYIYI